MRNLHDFYRLRTLSATGMDVSAGVNELSGLEEDFRHLSVAEAVTYESPSHPRLIAVINSRRAKRAKAVASEGRATRGTEAGADIRGLLQQGVMEQGQKKSETLLSGKISDSFDSGRDEQPSL